MQYFYLNIPQLIQYLGGQDTMDDWDVQQIIEIRRIMVLDDTVVYLGSILTTSTPAAFHGDSSVQFF